MVGELVLLSQEFARISVTTIKVIYIEISCQNH